MKEEVSTKIEEDSINEQTKCISINPEVFDEMKTLEGKKK
jgi:hypothetical protein